MKLALVAFALLAPLGLRAQETLLVCDGTATGSYAPIKSGGGSQTEFIYPASLLEEMEGASITAVKFFSSSSSTTNYSNTVTVYVQEVASSTVLSSAWQYNQASATKVYEGTTLTVTGGELVIEFTTPFEYQGGNLCFNIWSASNTPSVNYYYLATTSSCGYDYYITPPVSNPYSTGNYLPKAEFTYEPAQQGGDVCEKPTTCDVSNLAATSATLTWGGGSGRYNVELKAGSDDWATVLSSTNLTTTTLNLEPATTYQARVQSVCDGTTPTSSWKTSSSFLTPCLAVTTFPWSENFDSHNTGAFSAPCWVNEHISGSGTNVFQISTSNNQAGSTKTLNLPDMSNGTMTKLRLPEMTLPAGDNYIFTIDVYRNASGSSYTSEGVRVYASTDGEIEGATELGFLYRNYTQTDGGVVGVESASGWYTYELPIPFTGTCYIILRGESSYGSATYMDNFKVSKVLPCVKPSSPTFVSSTTTTATLDWTNGAEGQTAWQIAYSTDPNFDPASVTPVDVTVKPGTITGLTASTVYYAYVRANCDEQGYSEWSAAKCQFATACEAIATFPWNENFEGFDASSSGVKLEAPCWENIHLAGTGTYFFEVWSGTNDNNSTKQLRLHDMSEGTQTKLRLPEMTLPNNNYQFVLDVYRTSNYADKTAEGIRVYVSTDGEIEGATELAFIPRVFSVSSSVIPAESTGNRWYTYELPIGISGSCYIILRGESQYGTATYMDNFVVEQIPTCRKPKDVACSTTTAHSTTLSWTNGAEGQTAWQVAYSTDPDFNPNSVTPVDVTSNPATIEGLAQSTTYYAYVRANCGNVDGVSDWSITKVTFATIDGNVTPTGLAVADVTISSSQATASWNAVAGNTLHQSYDIYWATADVNTVPDEPAAPNYISGITNTSQLISGLNPSTDYKVWVRDNCGTDGYSDWSAAVPFTTLAACPSPQNLAVGTVIANEATVTWTTHAENDGYTVKYRKATTAPVSVNETYDFEDGMQGWTTIDGDGHGDAWSRYNGNAHGGSYSMKATYNSSYAHQDYLVSPQIALGGTFSFYAKKGGSYNDNFRVYLSTTGNVDASDFTIELTDGDVTPTTTYGQYSYNLSAYSGMGYVAIVYTAPADQLNLSIDDINYAYNVPGVYGEWQTVNNATSPQTITGLDPESYYEAKVYGVCGGNQEATGSNTVNFTTLPSCLAPTALTVYAYANTYVDLRWTRNSDEETSWQLCFNGDEEHLVNVTSGYTVNGSVISYLTPENTLDPATAYTVKVRTYCSNTDQSAWSNVESFTTMVACPVPTGLDATIITTTTADLVWTPGLNETEWTIYYKKTSEAEYHEVSGVTEYNPYTLENLEPSSSYVYYVVANCSAVEESDPSSTFNFNTECEAITVTKNNTYSEGFEGYTGVAYNVAGEVPVCWNSYGASSPTPHIIGQGTGSYVYLHNGTKALSFYGSGYCYAAMPIFSNALSELEIKFWMQTESSSYGTLTLGYITDGDVNYNTFTEIETYERNEGSMVQRTTDLNNVPAEAARLVFRWYYSGQWSCCIDDVEVVIAPESYTKAIDANKWYAIASPVHNSGDNETLAGVTNLTGDTYDLYGYTESTGTWDKPTTTLDLGKGYIYRRSTAATLTFVGYDNEGNKEVSITNACADANIDGFNLIGNPFPHVISYSNYYTLQPNGLWLAHDAGTIGVAEGFLVHTDASGSEQIIIDDATPSKKSAPAASPAITFTVSNGEFRDVAYARFDGSAVLPKIGHLEPNAPALSIPVNGKKYAIADLGNGCESFDMVFSGIGDYTISASGDVAYLHLIDKVTGKDIDLLSQSYTFRANMGDITSRFIVKLVPGGETVSAGNFAFRNGNGWTIEGDGTLEAYDALGRRIFAQEISSSNYQLSKASFPAAGVYVLRMGGNSQKIVVTE